MYEAKARRWRTPLCLKTPRRVPVDLDSSFMSVEMMDESTAASARKADENIIRIVLSSGEKSQRRSEATNEQLAAEERKRQKLQATANIERRKRMRVSHSATAKKPTAPEHNAPAVDINNGARKLDFGSQPQASNSNLDSRLLEKLTLFESNINTTDVSALKSTLSEVQSMLQTTNNAVLKERMNAVLERGGRKLQQLQMVENLREQGNSFYKQQDYLNAEKAYNEAIRMEPNQATLYNNRAAARIMLGRNADAIADCERAVLLDPSLEKAYVRAARASLNMGDTYSAYARLQQVVQISESARDKQGFCQAAFELENAIKQYSDLMTEGEHVLGLDDGSMAVQKAMAALTIAPSSIRAKCLLIIGQLIVDLKADSSNEPLATALRELEAKVGRGGYADVYQYGVALFSRAYLTEASAVLGLARLWAPSDAEISRNCEIVCSIEGLVKRAKRLLDENRFEDSIRLCNEALTLARQNAVLCAQILVLRAKNYVRAGNTVEAERDIQESLRLAADYFPARITLGWIFLAYGKADLAEKEMCSVETKYSAVLRAAHRTEMLQIREEIHSRIRAEREREARRQANQHASSSSSKPTFKTSASKTSSQFHDENDVARFCNQRQNHYMVLGVSKHATREEIRRAYRMKALKFHPDKNPHPFAAEAFKRIVEAATVISSPSKRRMYDITLL